MKRVAAAVLLSWLVGCGGFDERAVLDAVARHRTHGFSEVTAAPNASVHMGALVRVWVSDGAVDAYRRVGRAGASVVAQAEGTTLVKEHLDGQGNVATMTVMAKGPRGFAPDAGDWFWAQTDATARVNGTFSGQVRFCIDCHAQRAASDWVWGLPP